MLVLPKGEKKFEDMFSCFEFRYNRPTVHERDRRTPRRSI